MIRWGIIGAGNIAKRFVKGLEYDSRASLYAVACRTEEKAKSFKKHANFEIAYGNYNDLINDPNVDAIYISLPHKYHFEWTVKALKNKKAVLCEKPATINAKEIEYISKIAQENHTFFMEAMKSRFIPMYQYIKQLICQGTIGKLKYVSASFCFDLRNQYHNYLYDPVQGGCLFDTGIYAVGFLEDLLGGSYKVLKVDYRYLRGVDSYVKAIIDFNGITGEFECAMDYFKERNGIVEGTKGEIFIQEFHRPTDIKVSLNNKIEYIKHIGYENNDFYSEIKEVNDCIINGNIESKIMPYADSIKCAEIIECIKSMMK